MLRMRCYCHTQTIHVWKLFFFIFLTFAELPAQEINELQAAAIKDRDFKKAIEIQLEKIDLDKLEVKGIQTQELALLYLKDQDQEKAFLAFLKALELSKNEQETCSQDVNEYKKAFAIYIDPSAESPKATASNLLKELLPILNENPCQHLLDYFVAIAYANLGKYEEFFTHFYKAYRFYPQHYLAFKTKAVLHIKLLERTRAELLRNVQRQYVMENLLIAMEHEPLDTTVYRLLISFCPKEKKAAQVRLCLNKIIDGNIIVPRSDLMFYVIEAVDVDDDELAERFIALSHGWYPQSRIVEEARNYLSRHRK